MSETARAPDAPDLALIAHEIEDHARLAAIVDAAADAIVGTTPDGTITDWNPAAERLFGYTAREIQGSTVRRLYPPDASDTEFATITAAIRAGERYGPVLTRRRRRDGTTVDVSLTVAPIRDAHGDVVAAAKIFRDVGQQLREHRLLERLVAAGEALGAERLDRGRIADIVLREAVDAFRAALAGFFVIEGGRLRTVGHHGARRELLEAMERLPLDTPGWAAGDAVRTGTPLFFATERELERAFPSVHDLPVRSGYRGGLAYVPLLASGTVLGLLGLRFDGSRALTDAEQGFLKGFAHQAALALERVLAFEAELAARQAAQVAADRERRATLRAEVLARAADVLARSAESISALREVIRVVVPVLSEGCLIHLETPGGHELAAAHVAGTATERTGSAAGVVGTSLDDAVAATLRTGRSGTVPSVAIPDIDGPRAVLVVPLIAHERPLGTLSLVGPTASRSLAPEDAALAMELARRIATAIENHRLYDDLARARERAELLAAASERLSRPLDPETLRDIARLVVPRIADWCFVSLVDREGARVIAAAEHADPALAWLAERTRRERRSVDPIRLEGPVFEPELTEERLRTYSEDDAHLELWHAFDARSYLAVPIAGRGGVLGSLALLTRRGGRALTPADAAIAEELARRIAPAVETSRLYDDLRESAALEAARAQEVEAVLHAVGDPLVVGDADGRVRMANQAAVDAFDGDLPASIAGLRARFGGSAVLPEWSGSGPAGPVPAALRGTSRWYEVAAYPIPGASDEGTGSARGEQAAVIVVLRDVTERRLADQLRDAFIGVLSHELRTPITTIYGGSRVLLREGLDESTRREVASDVVTEAERLHRLVEDLLIVARAERGAMDLGGDPVLVQHVIGRAVRSEAGRWPEVRIDVDVRGSLPAVRGDETYVEQIIRNLLGNAAKYGGSGTTVELVAEDADHEVIVRILDDGPGFPAEDAGRLFDLFYRGQQATTTPGAGIGLFVCRALAGAMGGRIWAHPRPAGGSEFGFALPVYGEDGVD